MDLFQWHAALMMVGCCFIFTAVLAAMTQRRKRWWLKAHRVAGLAGTTLMLCGAAAAFSAVALAEETHVRTPHAWIGILTLATAAVTPLLGFLQFRMRQQAGRLRSAHRFCGRLLTGAALITILLGLRLIGYL